MKLFAPHNFRHLGIDYNAGWFNVADSVGAELISFGYARTTDDPLIDQIVPNRFTSLTALQAAHAASPLPDGVYKITGSNTVWVSDGVRLTPQKINKTTPYQLRKLRERLAAVAANKGRCTIGFFGDSITAGAYSSGAAYTGNKAISMPTLVGKAIGDRTGLPINYGFQLADNSVTSHGLPETPDQTLPDYNPEIAFGANWGASSSRSTSGGQAIWSSAGALGTAPQETLTYTPARAWDTAIIKRLKYTGSGVFVIDAAGGLVGGPVTTTSSGGAGDVGAYDSITVTKAAPATGALTLQRTSAATVEIFAIETYDSTAASIDILNFGWPGALASTLATDSQYYWTEYKTITQHGCHAFVLQIGTNEILNGVSAATFTTNLTTIVTKMLTAGDVMLLVPPPLGTAFAAQQTLINNAIYAVGLAMGVPVVADFYDRWGSLAISPNYYHTDNIHPINLGYQDMANAIADFILS